MDVAAVPEHTASKAGRHVNHEDKQDDEYDDDDDNDAAFHASDKLTIVQWTSDDNPMTSEHPDMQSDDRTVNLISFSTNSNPATPALLPLSSSPCPFVPLPPPHADPFSCETRSQVESKPVLLNNDSTMKKGLLWQMKDGGGFFNRWKERYFILTKDYLTCFKKSSSNLSFLGSEMGSFAYKLKLLEIDSITWKSCSDCSTRSRIIPRSMRTIGKKSKKRKHKRSQSTDHNHKSSDGENENSGTESSDNASSTRTTSRKSSFKTGVREVISIVIRDTRSQIDLWTTADSCLNDWMFMLKEACSHSKGRREALIKKSQTLCAPSPSHQPFALTSYWATARKSQDRPLERNSQAADAEQMSYLKSYSSLRIGSKPSSCSFSPSSTSTNCHQRTGSKQRTGGGGGWSRRGNSDAKSGNQRSESMINFSKRLSILTGKEILFPASEDQERDCDEEDLHHTGHEGTGSQSNQSHSQDHSSTSSSVIRIRERMSAPSGRDQSTEAGSVQYRQHHQDFGAAGGSSPSGNIREVAPPLRQSSLVSLDRRLITRPGGPVSQSNLSHHHPLPPLPPSNNDSVRRSALLRSASGLATTGGAFSTLGPNHLPSASPQSSPAAGNLVSQPVPRSLQVSPALTQRSLYAQHIFSQPDGPSPVFCTTSRVTSSGRERSSCGTPLSWMKEEYLRHGSGSRQENYNGSSMKSATSEFSFCRPDSPLTLPYNKSKSFYGRPVSTGGILSSNPSIHSACCNPAAAAAGALPPPRPPLPKQVSLEESSTLFRCSAAATQAKAKAKAAAAAAAANASLGSTGSAFSTSIDSSSGGSCSTTSSSARSSSLVPESTADFISRPSSCHYDPRSETLEDLTSKIRIDDHTKGSGGGASRKNRMNRILEKTSIQFSR